MRWMLGATVGRRRKKNRRQVLLKAKAVNEVDHKPRRRQYEGDSSNLQRVNFFRFANT
jgi:hypothetical protein